MKATTSSNAASRTASRYPSRELYTLRLTRNRVSAVTFVGVLLLATSGCRKQEPEKANQPPAARAEEAPAQPKRMRLESLDWDSAPRWSRELQFDANLGTVYAWSCAEVRALKAQHEKSPAQDEFDKKERESAVSKAEADCLARMKSAAKPLPAVVRLDVDLKLNGDFNFDRGAFPMLLKEGTGKSASAFSFREADASYIDGSRVLALMAEADNGKSELWTLPYLSGVALEPAPEKYFPSKNEFVIPVAATDVAKQLKPRLQKNGAIAQLLVAPGDPKKGTGIAFRKGGGTLAILTQDVLNGVRARSIAIRFVVENEVIAGPFDLQP